jgi:hypothetical protein
MEQVNRGRKTVAPCFKRSIRPPKRPGCGTGFPRERAITPAPPSARAGPRDETPCAPNHGDHGHGWNKETGAGNLLHRVSYVPFAHRNALRPARWNNGTGAGNLLHGVSYVPFARSPRRRRDLLLLGADRAGTPQRLHRRPRGSACPSTITSTSPPRVC